MLMLHNRYLEKLTLEAEIIGWDVSLCDRGKLPQVLAQRKEKIDGTRRITAREVQQQTMSLPVGCS